MEPKERLKEIIKRKRIKQEDLSKQTKISQQSLSRFFNKSSKDFEKMNKICQAIGIEPHDLWIPKGAQIESMKLPDATANFLIAFNKLTPELRDLLIDFTFRISGLLGKKSTP